jgi:N-methylhydantoinase B
VNIGDVVTYKAGVGNASGLIDADPVTTEVIRESMNSAARQMKIALIRTAFTPVIYEVLDFAVALYDRQYRLLAQAPSLPIFMGTLSFCVGGAVERVGGADALQRGDVVVFNEPYSTGAHPQDLAMVMPVFDAEEHLVGYAAMRAHMLDLGAKDPYCTDTVDVFQEGMIFPGVKLLRQGELVGDIYRTALANSRFPKALAGDINAMVVALSSGASALERIVATHGREDFFRSVEKIFDHGEAVVREYFEKLPDGEYAGQGCLDSNGVDDHPVPFEVRLTVRGSEVEVDYSAAPDAGPGPLNSVLPTTVAGTRIAIATLAGASEAPNEGHFRPIQIKTRVGSMFHAVSPSPCFLTDWPAGQAMEVIYQAVAEAMVGAVPAGSGGDPCVSVWWGNREETGEPWGDASAGTVGQGAHARGDGANALMHVSSAAMRFPGAEIWEGKNPWIIERSELAADSGGVGQYRGGLGHNMYFQMLEDTWLTAPVERTRNGGWGLAGGGVGRTNQWYLRRPDGSLERFEKVTRMLIPAGCTVELRSGGGGGFGRPQDRDPEAVRSDLRAGYITEEHARTYYSHALA